MKENKSRNLGVDVLGKSLRNTLWQIAAWDCSLEGCIKETSIVLLSGPDFEVEV